MSTQTHIHAYAHTYTHTVSASNSGLSPLKDGVNCPLTFLPTYPTHLPPSLSTYLTYPPTYPPTVSASNSGLGVVRSLSPLKMELAPARNMSACSPCEKERRPVARWGWVGG